MPLLGYLKISDSKSEKYEILYFYVSFAQEWGGVGGGGGRMGLNKISNQKISTKDIGS
jgi:hypothetical protein